MPFVEIVRVDVPPAELIDDGVKVALAPDGKPEAVRLTVCALPLVSVAVTVVETLLPGLTEPDAGEAASEKSLPTGQDASLPATLTAVHAAWTALYSAEQSPYRSVAAERLYARAVFAGLDVLT